MNEEFSAEAGFREQEELESRLQRAVQEQFGHFAREACGLAVAGDLTVGWAMQRWAELAADSVYQADLLDESLPSKELVRDLTDSDVMVAFFVELERAVIDAKAAGFTSAEIAEALEEVFPSNIVAAGALRRITAAVGKWLSKWFKKSPKWPERVNHAVAKAFTGYYNQVRLARMERAGFRKKKWVAVMDEKTRPSHRVAHGQVVGLAESFRVGMELLRYPGDKLGTPGETINCRCIVVPERD